MTSVDTAVKKISTPCIRKCNLLDDICQGCKRSWCQIRDWSFYSEEQRLKIMEDLKQKTIDKPKMNW